MHNVSIVFPSPWQVEVRREPVRTGPPEAGQLLVRKAVTLISPGTELACLSGREGWFALPGVPGYAAISEVLEKGPDTEGFEPGDLLLHYGKHQLYETISLDNRFSVHAKVTGGTALEQLVFARMAAVAMTAIRISDIQLGDRVAVTGLGLVGNLAAQLAALQGAEVIGVDLSEKRMEIARACGVAYPIPGGESAGETVRSLTGGAGVSTLIEATGVPQVAQMSLAWVARYGEAILLGSPRGEYQGDVTDLLNHVHLNERGCVTLKGAHEWRLPLLPNPYVKHSLARNVDILLKLIAEDRLKVKPLLSHVLEPADAPAAYEGLRNNKDEYLGVVFDWRRLGA